MADTDPLADVLRDLLDVNEGIYTREAAVILARAAREHIAGEIGAEADKAQPPLNEVHAAYWSGMDNAARIVRGGTP